MPKVSSTRSGFKSAVVTGNKTLTAADSGIVQEVRKNATITLPSTTLGLSFTIQVGVDQATGNAPEVKVAPAAADGITGNGFTAAVNKSANAPTEPGALISVLGTGTAGVTGWVAQEVIGDWTRAA